MSDTEAETPPEYRRLDREALGRLLDQWIPWLDPRRPNRLTATTLADALWGAAWPATGPAELDVEILAKALHGTGTLAQGDPALWGSCINWEPGYGYLDATDALRDDHGPAEHMDEAANLLQRIEWARS